MFDTSKYNWATSQIETVIAFDLGGTDFMIDWCRQFFGQDYVRELIISCKKETGCTFYDAISTCLRGCLNQPYDDNNPMDMAASKSSKRCYLTALAAVKIKKKSFGAPSQAYDFIRKGYQEYDLGELQL